MPVDSFRYCSRLITRYYQYTRVEAQLPIPWTALKRPLSQLCFGLVTTGGLYVRGLEAPFDLEREQREPNWGDPGFRTLPTDMNPADVAVSHHHIYKKDVLDDINILLPITRFQELARAGRIGSLAAHAYSFMGFQGYPADLSGWRDTYAPQVAGKLQAEGVDCVFITTA